MPLVRRDGTTFGTLCALDTLPANLTEEHLEAFKLFAELIAAELEADEKQREKELELLEAERIGELREKLFDILGHDLRNPLNTIAMANRILSKNENFQSAELKLTKKIAESVGRMDRMIGDLLDLSRTRLEEGIPINRQPCDLRNICLQMIDDFSIGYPNRTILFESEGETQGRYDADRIKQVISNLIGNALEHGAKKTPVTVKLSGNETNVILSAHNHGNPIPAESLATLFNPYRRAIENKNKSKVGLGLGLYIVQQIVLAHKGAIEVESNENIGTIFTVKLPRE